MDQLNQDFLTFIELLEKENVDYLVVGGYAVGLHGFPRYTGDIDFFVKISEENASRILKVFDEFGFGGIGLSLGDFLEENFVVEIGREPRKIQVLTGIDGVTFNECFQRKIEATIGRMNVKFIGKEDLIMNKAASGRSKDRIDLEELKKL
jgi:predicted nucleotidyltransferase